MTEPVSKKSGVFFRKLRAQKNEDFQGVLDKTQKIQTFFHPKKATNIQSSETEQDNSIKDGDQNSSESIPRVEIVNEKCQNANSQNAVDLDSNENVENPIFVENVIDDSFDSITDGDDLSKWLLKDSTFVTRFLKSKIQQNVQDLDLSKSKRCTNGVNRSCTQNLFFKKKQNGEVHQRTWIFYSEFLGKMFCIYCIFFAVKRSGSFVDTGFDDWRHTNRICDHETSKYHCESAYDFTKRLMEVNSVNSALAQQAIVQHKYWKDILKRILTTIRFLSSRGLPFRGKNELLGNSHNGNYLGTLELLAEWDPLLKSHLEKYGNKGRGNTSYLSSTICNEFIELLAAEVRSKILELIKHRRDGAANLTEVYSTDLGEDFVEECIHFKCFMDDIKREMDKECEHYYIDSESDGETTNESDTHRKKRVSKPAKMLQYIKKYKIEPTFPNLEVALRIFECFAVANCSGERSFSALKRVKSFYRSSVKEKKLNATSVLYIENDVLNEIDIDLVIDQFVDSKARKRFI